MDEMHIVPVGNIPKPPLQLPVLHRQNQLIWVIGQWCEELNYLVKYPDELPPLSGYIPKLGEFVVIIA